MNLPNTQAKKLSSTQASLSRANLKINCTETTQKDTPYRFLPVINTVIHSAAVHFLLQINSTD